MVKVFCDPRSLIDPISLLTCAADTVPSCLHKRRTLGLAVSREAQPQVTESKP